MTVQLSSPEGLMQPVPYHHVAVVTGTRQIHVAGQVSRAADGTPLAPGDLGGQVAHALRNVGAALGGVGAEFRDVMRLTFYVTGWSPEKVTDLMAGVEEVADELGLSLPMPPATLVGVAALFEPDVLVEIEATAVVA